MKLAFALMLAPTLSPAAPIVGTTLPAGAVRFERDGWTQRLARNIDDRPTFAYVDVKELEAKWHQSGGMEGVKHTSRKYRTLSAGKTVTYLRAPVTTTFTAGGREWNQREWGLTRTYPDGTRFDDVLSYRGKVFEHRTREKVAGEWKNRVTKVEANRPPGYVGLTQSCASCHDEAGTGKYGAGLVPGGDTVLSDPMDWTALNATPWPSRPPGR